MQTLIAICLFAGLLAAGCGITGSSDGRNSGHASGLQGGLEPDAGSGVAGASGSPAGSCEGLPGSPMAEVTTPKGVKYCIDTLEVSQSDYAEFLKRTTAKPGSEHPDCASNLSYLPVQDIDDPYEKKTCLKGKDWSPETTPNRPVVCVDWCDAHAYCQSAGKRLCGKVGGGSGSADDVSNADLSQWFAACSQGGMTAFPYGDTYDAQRCRGSEVSKLASGPGEAWLPQTDTAAWPNCRGSSPPYSSILNMSGLVAEHTDERLWVEGPAGGAWSCIDRGGNFRDSEPRLTCANFGSGSCGASPLVGFRCCKDLQ